MPACFIELTALFLIKIEFCSINYVIFDVANEKHFRNKLRPFDFLHLFGGTYIGMYVVFEIIWWSRIKDWTIFARPYLHVTV